MPRRPFKACTIPGCPNRVPRGTCPEHRTPDRRPSARQRGYDAEWEAIAAAYLAAHPWCETPTCPEAATDVDHIDGSGPRGNNDWSNLQALCHPCHSRKTALHDGGFGRRGRGR